MARERLLAGAGEDTIHANIITADTTKDKIANWWYYNKKILLLVIFLVAVAVSVAVSIFSQEKPDYVIALANAYAIDEEAIAIAENHMADYGEDLNGDGKVVVDIRNYYFLLNDHEDQELASSIYAAEHLHTPLVVVLGHTSCGAIASAMEAIEGMMPPLGHALSPLLRGVAAAIGQEKDPDAAAIANVQASLRTLAADPIIQHLQHDEGLQLKGALYHTDSGAVEFL